MGSFFDRAMAKIRKREEAVAEVRLSAFGKHPGWDDHIEDLGLDTDILVAVRRVLYLQGIGGNIDSGTWETGDEDDRLPGFSHLFIWRFGSDLVLGRMWSSRDGKGRTRYPMIVCAHCSHLPLRWAVKEVLPRLEAIEQQCVATTEAADVRAIITGNNQALQESAVGVEPVEEPLFASPRALARLAMRPEMEPDHRGMHRIIYQMEREMAAFHLRASDSSSSTRSLSFRPHQMRLPLCADSREEALQVWLSFLPSQLDPSTPVLLIARLDQPWLDLIVGEPGVQQFQCLRASAKAIPLATDIPYTLEDALVERIEYDIDVSRAGTVHIPGHLPPRPEAAPAPEPEAPPEPEPAVAVAPRPKRSFAQQLRKNWWVFLLVAIVLALAIAAPAIVEMLNIEPRNGRGIEPEGWGTAEAQAWRDLCTAYNGWLARFLADASGKRLERWRQDPELARLVVARIDAARGIVFDPRRIAHREGVPVEDLAQDPPPGAKTPEAIASTRKALDAVQAIASAISQWPSAGDRGIADLAALYAGDRGWTRQARQLETVAESVKPAPGFAIAKAVDNALEVQRQLAVIEALFAKIQGHRDAAQILGDDLVAQLGDHVLAETRATASLKALHARLADLEKLAADIAASAEPVRTHAQQIQAIAGEPFGKRFVECARPRIEGADALRDLPTRLKLVNGLAPGIESRLKAIKGHADAVLDLGDKPLADKFWDCALGETASAKTLMALTERLEQVKAAAPQVAARRKVVAKHHQAIMGLGIATLERHGQHIAQSVADAKDMKSLLDGLGRSADLIAGAAERWKEIQKLQKTIVGSGDKILAQFAKYPPARVNAENNIATLPATLDAIKADAQQLAGLIEHDWKSGRIDRERFTRDSNVHRSFKGEVTDQTLQDWRTEVAAYYRLDAAADPRLPRDLWDRPMSDVQWRIAFLKDSDDPAKKKKGQQYVKQLGALEAKLAALRKLPWIKDNQASICETAGGLRKQLDALKGELKDVIEPPADWLKRVRAIGQIGDSEAVRREWAKRRSDLVTDKVTAKALEGFREVYARLWRNVRTLREFLAGLDDAKAMPKGLPDAAKKLPPSDTLKAAAKAIDARRELAIQGAIEAITWGDDKIPATSLADYKEGKPWKDACTQYVRWRTDAARLIVDFLAIEAALDAGYLLDDKPATAPDSPGKLYARWKDHKLLDGLRDPLKPVLARLDDLAAIKGLKRDNLVQRIERGGPPDATLAVWLRLGLKDDWPGSLAELRLELKAREALRGAAMAIKARDADRGKWLEARLAAEGPRRWERAFKALAAKAGADDLRDKDLAGVLQLIEPFGVDRERLKPETRLRVRLYDLRDKAAALTEKAPKQDVVRLIGAFQKDASALRSVAGRPPVAALLDELKQIRELKDDDRPSVGLGKAGPMASPIGSQWKAQTLDEGKAVVYTWGGKDHTLKFVRIEPADKTAKPAYLATTEVPVGLFIDAMAAADRWVEANSLLRIYDPEYESLGGPRVWEWKAGGGGEIRLTRQWLARERGRGKHYADGLKPGSPAKRHPMQYISAAGALYFARLLGCRLPSPSEWRAAYDAFAKGARPNLRDATWRKQLDFVREKRATKIAAEWPDAGVFWPPGVDRKGGSDATVTATDDDGVLWFDDVGEHGSFRHLVGNVAEFLLDHPARFDQSFRESDRLKAAAVLKFLKQHAADLRVVGGSALSPPELWNGKDKPFHKPWPVDAADSRDGYSDVGFRLAFTAPRETPAERLQRVLRAHGYLASLDK